MIGGDGTLVDSAMTTESLPKELRSFVTDQLGSGRYETLDELLAEAVRLLREQEAFLDQHSDEIRSELAAGIAEAERGEVVDGEEAMERLRLDLRGRRREG